MLFLPSVYLFFFFKKYNWILNINFLFKIDLIKYFFLKINIFVKNSIFFFNNNIFYKKYLLFFIKNNFLIFLIFNFFSFFSNFFFFLNKINFFFFQFFFFKNFKLLKFLLVFFKINKIKILLFDKICLKNLTNLLIFLNIPFVCLLWFFFFNSSSIIFIFNLFLKLKKLIFFKNFKQKFIN